MLWSEFGATKCDFDGAGGSCEARRAVCDNWELTRALRRDLAAKTVLGCAVIFCDIKGDRGDIRGVCNEGGEVDEGRNDVKVLGELLGRCL